MSTDYDSPWKEALDHYFEQFLLLLFPEIDAEIDWSRGYEPARWAARQASVSPR